MRLINDSIVRTIRGKTVLVPLPGNETDFTGMIALNETGGFLCRLLQQPTTRDALAAALVREYAVEAPQAQEDVDDFLRRLEECRLLVP